MPWISPVEVRVWPEAPVGPCREGVRAATGFRALGVVALLADFLVTVALLAFLGVAFLRVPAFGAGVEAAAALPRLEAALAAVVLAGAFLVAAGTGLAGVLATLALAFFAAGLLAGDFLATGGFFEAPAFFAAGLLLTDFFVAALPAVDFRVLDALAPAAVLPAFFLLDRDAAAITLAP